MDSPLNQISPSIPKTVTEFTNKIDRVYRGLGRPILFNVLSVLANKSVLLIGNRGFGKTLAIKQTPIPHGYLVKNWDSFTFDQLNSFCRKNRDEGFNGILGRHLVFKIEEISALQQYHRELLLTVISKIITDRNYEHVTSWTPNLSFENCRLTCLIAIQPVIYSTLCSKNSQWKAMSSDRFVKFLLLNPLRNKTVDFTNLDLTCEINSIKDVTLPENLDVTKVNDLFVDQISAGRSRLYTDSYLKAYAKFNGKATVTQSDVEEFEFLFKPYLKSFNDLQRALPDYSLYVSAGDLKVLMAIASCGLRKVSKQELIKILKCSKKMLEKTTSNLIGAGLINKVEDKNERGKPVSYELNGYLKKYFTEYAKNL